MTISSTTRIAGPFLSGTALPFTFKVFAAADLDVIRLNTTTGVESTLVINTDYTVTLNDNQNTNPGGTVNLTVAASATSTVTLTSDMSNLQPTDLTNQGGFYPEVITDALDRATIQIQQISGIGDRTVKAPISDGSIDMQLPTASIRANKYMTFDAAGLPTVSSGSGTDTALRTDLANNSVALAGSNLVGFRQSAATSVARTVLTKLRETQSVMDFGAVGNGVTDDTAAFNAAWTASTPNPVFVPAGSYAITGTVTGSFVTSGSVTIVGGTVNSISTYGVNATIAGNATISGNATITGTTTMTGDLAVNGADITTTATGTATVFNTNATTVNIAGAATTVSIGAATGTATINNANTVVAGDLAVNGADITTTATGTASLFNTNATTLNIGGAATTVQIGATTGDTYIRSDNLRFDSGYGSSGIAYGCRAWCNFNGDLATPISPRASGNVGSVTDNGTGDYTVNFSSAMPDANYACIVTADKDGAGNTGASGYTRDDTTARTTSAVRIGSTALGATTTAVFDSNVISVSIYR